MSPIITVRGLSKKYAIGRRAPDTTFRDAIAHRFSQIRSRTTDFARGKRNLKLADADEFWALKDVDFDVHRGEAVAIIGRNGAGKSTLLKVLSRITEPTEGRVTIRGRVASLLEVGTGFHSELTGRENIFLNGAILGMSRNEVRQKFDEIVSFAEIERFLDTPVKRYSSGMYVRLAFAVAAHLEPEVLIVDEVLAVGDSEFQKKCLGKMESVSRQEGRTVLFVSHNIAAVGELTKKAVLLEQGRVKSVGLTEDVIGLYVSSGRHQSTYARNSSATETPHISKVEVITSDPNGVHRFGSPLEIRFLIRHERAVPKACFSFQIVNQYQQPAIHAWALYPEVSFGSSPGQTTLTCRIPFLRLNIGQFYLRANLSDPPGGDVYERLDAICPFEVIQTEASRLWPWHPGDCVYHETWNWSTVDNWRTETSASPV